MIAALLLADDKIFAGRYDCKTCTEEEKKEMGCTEPINENKNSNGVWRIDFCIGFCDGDENCKICNGSNQTKVWRCPRALVNPEVQRLLPYFFDYYGALSNGLSLWPDGKGRLWQPKKLIQAFDIMAKQKLMKEEKKNG